MRYDDYTRSIRSGKIIQHNQFAPMGAHLFLLPGQNCALRGIFLFQISFIITGLASQRKNLCSSSAKIIHGELTRSLERDIQGCRNKHRPDGTNKRPRHLRWGRLLAQYKMLPGKPWVAPEMVWPLQPDGALSHKSSL